METELHQPSCSDSDVDVRISTMIVVMCQNEIFLIVYAEKKHLWTKIQVQIKKQIKIPFLFHLLFLYQNLSYGYSLEFDYVILKSITIYTCVSKIN